MREELLEYIVNCKKDTPIEELKHVCRNMEEVGFVLKYMFMLEESVIFFVVTVFIGEVISAGIFGSILTACLTKTNIFKRSKKER